MLMIVVAAIVVTIVVVVVVGKITIAISHYLKKLGRTKLERESFTCFG